MPSIAGQSLCRAAAITNKVGEAQISAPASFVSALKTAAGGCPAKPEKWMQSIN
ncbi:hypothetical protein [Sutterella wadsworthensis]|jgi:hypothetical protein|uniref:hypothetical protein n=1 Tax=Sutterella wadsworthensis TaxID=40545 RepID=UPI00241E4B8C|nr:hypothetical protein [Sutterella wadsworthensis]